MARATLRGNRRLRNSPVARRLGAMGARQAMFAVGQIIHHVRFDYRGVVVDVDPVFMGTDAWYEAVAKSRPPKDRPWYHVLVDGASHQTYVAERHLEPDDSLEPVRHPALAQYFEAIADGVYVPKEARN
jgi:heat shock protein HspQ